LSIVLSSGDANPFGRSYTSLILTLYNEGTITPHLGTPSEK
jgi:hypothetical protein